MEVNSWLTSATHKLDQAGIGTARLDALVLLEDVLGRDRAWLLAHPDTEISATSLSKLKKLLGRRVLHEPLAYLLKKSEFYCREFIITPAVLEPRPESETMIDMLKNLSGLPDRPFIADVGAGSGVLGITAALELPKARVELLEVDPDALKVAKMNVDKFTLPIHVLRSDLLDGLNHNASVLLCNLPYVPDDYQINLAAGHEPRLAIFGGPDGLDVYRKLFKQVVQRHYRPLYILCESLPPQQTALAAIANQAGYQLTQTDDFIQLFSPQK